MRDIRYKWRDGNKSVSISNGVQLPQFRVLGHRQKQTEINLTTGIDGYYPAPGCKLTSPDPEGVPLTPRDGRRLDLILYIL